MDRTLHLHTQMRFIRQSDKMKNVWQEPVPVRFGSVDRSDRLSLGAAFGFFQEAAISHAADLGCGLDALAEIKQGWVLSRIAIFMERRPGYEETVLVESWPRGCEKLFAIRDYDMRDPDGRPIVRGRGNWLILDIERRRPLRAREVMEKLPLNEGLNALWGGGLPALVQRENLVKTGERKAAYSDIDYYGHVNNARYVQWIQDITDPGLLDKADQVRLDVNYVSEVLPGETVELWTAPIETGLPPDACAADYPALTEAAFAFEGQRHPDTEKTGQVVFRAELRTGRL
jgi:acyl-ACP thioesterase